MMKLLLLLFLLVCLLGTGFCSYAAYESFKIRDKFIGCLFGFNVPLFIILFVLGIIKATML